jgi:hypothetical protein
MASPSGDCLIFHPRREPRQRETNDWSSPARRGIPRSIASQAAFRPAESRAGSSAPASPPPAEKRKTLVLDPLRISGVLSLQTPICVLVDVAQSQTSEDFSPVSGPGQSRASRDSAAPPSAEELHVPSARDGWVRALAARKPLVLDSSSLELGSLKHLARYVDPSRSWRYDELWTAFLELEAQARPFGSDCGRVPEWRPAAAPFSLCQLRQLVAEAEVGRPAPGKKTLTVSFLYRLAAWLGAPLALDIAPEDLKTLVLSYLAGYGPHMASLLILRGLGGTAAGPGRATYALPQTREAAIALAAERFALDLGWLDDPVIAYVELMANGMSGAVTALKNRNSRLCELGHVFNPVLRKAYPKDMIRTFLRELGLPSTARKEELAAAVESVTFWPGWYPSIGNPGGQTTVTMEPIASIPSQELICFGKVRERLTAFTYEELADFLHQQDTPCMMADGKTPPLSRAQIRRLALLTRAQEGQAENSAGGVPALKRRVSLELNRLSDRLTSADAVVAAMVAAFTGKCAKAVAAALRRLFILAMVMRGWDKKPQTPLPLVNAATAEENDPVVDIRTWREIEKLEQLSRHTGFDFLALPMVRNLTGSYERYTAADGGVTLRERLAIVKQGETTSNVHSCIHITSNLFAWSALFYMGKLGIKQPIAVGELQSVA